MKRWLTVLGTGALCVLALCGSRAAAEGDGPWGTLKGQVVWGGAKLPVLAPIKIDDKNKADCLKASNGQPTPNEKWVINPKNKGIRDVFVWLANADPKNKKPLPIHPSLKDITVKEVVIDQPACHFVPHAIALREGQKLIVKNSAPFSHNFKWSGEPGMKNGEGNSALAPGSSMTIDFVASRLPIQVQCNLHPWMNGWIRVYNHPYFAVTDDDGNFEFKNAPAGSYRLMIWHGSAGWKGGAAGRNGDPVTIPGDLKTIAFPPPVED